MDPREYTGLLGPQKLLGTPGLDILANSLRYAPESRPVGTIFDVKYRKAHSLEVQAILASEILDIDLLLNTLEAYRPQPNFYQ